MGKGQGTPAGQHAAARMVGWVAALAALVVALAASQPVHAGDRPADAPEWLEPRGLSAVDLAGLVPEENLAGSILAFTSGGGIVQYAAGQRAGDTVTISTTVSPRLASPTLTGMNCLGQRAYNDSWEVSVPAAELRVYDGGNEITDKVIGLEYYPTGLDQPSRGAQGSRYDHTPSEPPAHTAAGAVIVPANAGCTIYLDGAYATLSATFVFTAPQTIAVEVLGSETSNFHSYIGPGDAGQVAGLAAQMLAYVDNVHFRHEKFLLTIPDGADYVWVNYPPTPVSAYTGVEIATNVQRPSSGTYRLARGAGLSVDHVVSQGLPLHAQYVEADLSGGAEYLEHLEPIDTLASPEYFVPSGVAYDPCMTSGDCPDDLLDAVYNATMSQTVYYYKVTRVSDDLTRVPLRQAGTSWVSGVGSASLHPATLAQELIPQVLLPLIARPEAITTPPPDDEPQAECPCGWFGPSGDMVDVTPGLPPSSSTE